MTALGNREPDGTNDIGARLLCCQETPWAEDSGSDLVNFIRATTVDKLEVSIAKYHGTGSLADSNFQFVLIFTAVPTELDFLYWIPTPPSAGRTSLQKGGYTMMPPVSR